MMKNSRQILIAIVISLVFLLVLLGSGETETPAKVGEAGSSNAPVATAKNSTPSNTPIETDSSIVNDNESSTSDSTKTFKIGDIIEMGNMQFCINGIRTSSGGEFYKPDEGNQYVILDISIKNISTEMQNSSSILMYKLVDLDGRSYDMDIFAETSGSLDRQLGSGRKARGEIAFETPTAIESFELEIDPNIFGSGLIVVEIPMSKANSEFEGAFANDSSDNVEHFQIGDIVKLSSLKYIVNSISTNTGSQYFKPDEGNVNLLIDITIENIGSESAHISSMLTFNLVNKEGIGYSISIFADTNGSLDGEIGSGRKMTGELAYEVPLNFNDFELEIYDSLFSTGIIVIDISVE